MDRLRVLLTREQGRNRELRRRLEKRGFDVSEAPLTITRPPCDPGSLDRAVADGPWDWIVFTSARSVRMFVAARRRTGRPPLPDPAAGTRLAAVGPATEKELRRHGRAADFVPGRSSAGEMARAWPESPAGQRILVPRAKEGRRELIEMLRSQGARVRDVEAYRTLERSLSARVIRDIASGQVDVVVLLAPSAARALARSLPASARRRFVALAVGETTARALEESQLGERVLVAERASVEGLEKALVDFRRRGILTT